MARPISSVHVDIARFVLEVSKVSAESPENPDKALAIWTRQLAECLAMRAPILHPYGAHLLSEVDEYRIAEKERKRVKFSAPSKESADSAESADSLPRTDQIRADHKRNTLPAGAGKSVSALSAESPEKPRNPYWDALVLAFNLKPVTKGEKALIGRVASAIKEKGDQPAEIPLRIERYKHRYPDAACTLTALEKHWDYLAKPGVAEVANRRKEYYR